MDLSKKKMKNKQISTKISLRDPFNDRDSKRTMGQICRSVDKTRYRAANFQPKLELDNVQKNIDNNFRVSLEPLDTKHLFRGNAREKDTSKWLSKKDFNSITSGETHRRKELADLRLKDEPYVNSRQAHQFRRRYAEKEISDSDFLIRTVPSHKSLSPINRTTYISAQDEKKVSPLSLLTENRRYLMSISQQKKQLAKNFTRNRYDDH